MCVSLHVLEKIKNVINFKIHEEKKIFMSNK